jgi:hypothetical protein
MSSGFLALYLYRRRMAGGESAWILGTSIGPHRRMNTRCPFANTLINAAADNKILSFMDGNAGYNHIFMAPEDIHKTAFRVLSVVGLFEYVVMTFGLKNAGAMY